MNVVALPVDDGYATLGHLIEREQVVEAIRTDGTSLGLFSTAVAAAAARACANPTGSSRPK